MRESNGLRYFVFPHLEQTGLIVHAITTRQGGVSLPPYESLNLAFHTGDNPEAVRQNRKIVSQALKFDFSSLVSCQQVHGTEVLKVDYGYQGSGSIAYENSIAKTDGLFAIQPGIPLMMNYADCVSLLILDPVKKIIGICHAGWKGTVNGIAAKAIRKMKEELYSSPRDCLVGIGPSIGPCCYEVDKNVVTPLADNFANWRKFTKPKGKDKWLLDLWSLNRWQLVAEGVKSKNIVESGMCTSCWHRLFFSHRASGGVTGRISAICLLK